MLEAGSKLLAAPSGMRVMIQINAAAVTHAMLIAICAAATGYALIAAATSLLKRRGSRTSAVAFRPPVTVLKPLCGDEPELYFCLRSFCELDYPAVQIVCGVQSAEDPAIATVRRLQHEFPQLDLQLVIESAAHGSNAKVSNLINTLPVARHDTLVISDSDVHVAPDYLDTVVPPLADPTVGLVTCAYRARPDASPWSRLVALFVNGWFMPAMRVGALFGSRSFASGATLALRRDVLERIGGFEAIADQLADDFWLGERIRHAGFTTLLAPITVETCVHEPGPRACMAHELRWLRTIRGIQPVGYAFSFITFGLPVGLLTAAALRGAGGTWILFALTLIARFIVHFADDSGRRAWRDVWLVPTSDALAVALWCWSFAGRRVRWRRGSLVAAPGGNALRIT